MDYLEELKQKHEEINKQVDQAQQQLNSLIVLRTKIEGAMEHKQYEIEKEKEKQEGDVRKEEPKKKK